MKILITGGPVYAKLDAVKIITNCFKGGLMADLANLFVNKVNFEVTYICSKDSKSPEFILINDGKIKMVYHDGFEDYRAKVLELAPKHDAVILGAAVANLVPLNPWAGKFPSHDYKPGDVIPINFTIATRVIDEVKKFAPYTHLYGFKLLSGASHGELIDAAYDVLLGSKATAVFANDTTNLFTKFIVTKDRAVQETDLNGIVNFVKDTITDTYYSTRKWENLAGDDFSKEVKAFKVLAETFERTFKPVKNYIFGTIAVRCGDSNSFLTTKRGKNSLTEMVTVCSVNHTEHIVVASQKATLNAPLLHWIFKHNPIVKAVVHYHECLPYFHTLPYAIPGTARDSCRPISEVQTSFNIESHGCFLLFDEKLKEI